MEPSYKHVAPLGLKTHYPMFSCFRVSLVIPTGMSPIPARVLERVGKPRPYEKTEGFSIAKQFIPFLHHRSSQCWQAAFRRADRIRLLCLQAPADVFASTQSPSQR